MLLVIKLTPSSSDISKIITSSCIPILLDTTPFLNEITQAFPKTVSIDVLISYSSLSSFLLKSVSIISIQFCSLQTLYKFNFSALVTTNCIKKFLYTFWAFVKSPFSSGNNVFSKIDLVCFACSIPFFTYDGSFIPILTSTG